MAVRASSRPRRKSGYEFLVSACLAGVNCTFKGTNNLNDAARDLVKEGRAIAVCPEVMGGLAIPRKRAEIAGGDGADVLMGRAMVVAIDGADVTMNYLEGARKALTLAKKYGIKKAILKSNSPSCGVGEIPSGSFVGRLKKGNGVTAAILIKNGIKVSSKDRT